MNFVPSDTLTRGNALSSTGAFVSYSGKNTGYQCYVIVDNLHTVHPLSMIQSDKGKLHGDNSIGGFLQLHSKFLRI